MQVDYIIVGQGLAGSAVAVQLLRRGKRIVVFDDPSSNNSSRIAAGLFNPVTGKKMVRTWLADKVFPYLGEYYRSLEARDTQKFFHPMSLIRPFVSIEEQNDWMARAGEDAYKPFIKKVITGAFQDGVHSAYGGLLLDQCGFLNTGKYIQAVRILIEQQGTLCSEVFSVDAMKVSESSIVYREIKASKIIFCTGVHENKYFSWLPIRSLKGEVLSLKMDLDEDFIVNRGVYLVPAGEKIWKAGATYFFHDQVPGITNEARVELVGKINELVSVPYEILDQQWGFRPTTPDRRPILGAHPRYKNVIVFNGLGTKGVSLAPYFSEVLVHWMEKGGTINKEVDIDRFKSVYSASS